MDIKHNRNLKTQFNLCDLNFVWLFPELCVSQKQYPHHVCAGNFLEKNIRCDHCMGHSVPDTGQFL